MSAAHRLRNLAAQLSVTSSSSPNLANTGRDMSPLEQTLARGVEEGLIPHAVVFATDVDGMGTHLSSLHCVGMYMPSWLQLMIDDK